jgi:hydroxymethylglutaryl-CoA lyase/(R)-citramalyl-CoA lyase
MIEICDVAPRDGLQNDPTALPPATRAELADRIAACGVPRVEVASFVHPNKVPRMAGAEAVVAALHRRDDVVYAGLVLNLRGYQRLVSTGLDEARYAIASTDAFSERNSGMPVAAALRDGEAIIAQARADGVRASATVATAFGCPFTGRVAPAKVLTIAERLVAMGAGEVILADTIGVATPRQVGALVREALALGGPVGVHLHNTRNTGYANAVAALEAGATVLDASTGGLGGCPFVPRATGNIATEDLVYLLEADGIATGVDLAGLIAVSEWLARALGHELEGYVHRAGAFPPLTPPRR